MDESFPPRVSCIYQIRCIPTGQIYVGSAANLRLRWDEHRRCLRHGNHPNTYLQKAWSKHSEHNFELSILEVAGRPELLRVEQAWLDSTRCWDRRVGFNVFRLAGSPGDMFARTWRGFVDPAGNSVTIFNLRDFCQQRRLDFSSMHRLAKGRSKLKSHRGWTHENSIRQRDYIKTHTGFVDPHGSPVGTIVNIAAFCRKNGLDPTHMVAVANGRICSHKGWTHQSGRKTLPPKTYAGFIGPDGKRTLITNLRMFCRQNGLEVVHMHEIKSGKRRSHKGWKWQARR